MSYSPNPANFDSNQNLETVKKILKIISGLLPFIPFLISILILSSFAPENSPLFTMLYTFAAISDCLKIFFATQVLDIKSIWLSKHTHDLILILDLWFFHNDSFIFVLSALFLYLLQGVKGMKKHIAPKLGEAEGSIQDLCTAILNLDILQQVRAALQIILPFYLFFKGLFSFKVVSFFIVFFGHTLYALVADQYHKEIYDQIKGLLQGLNIQFVDEFINRISKVSEFAQALYPVSN